MDNSEDLHVTLKHDIYPGIDPTSHYKAQTYKGKVVLVTGASRGIGQAIAIAYAKAGASLSLVARKKDTLEASKALILKETPTAKVEVFVADVVDETNGRPKMTLRDSIRAYGPTIKFLPSGAKDA